MIKPDHFDLNHMPKNQHDAAHCCNAVDEHLATLAEALQHAMTCEVEDHSEDVPGLMTAVEQMIVVQHIYRIAADALISN